MHFTVLITTYRSVTTYITLMTRICLDPSVIQFERRDSTGMKINNLVRTKNVEKYNEYVVNVITYLF